MMQNHLSGLCSALVLLLLGLSACSKNDSEGSENNDTSMDMELADMSSSNNDTSDSGKLDEGMESDLSSNDPMDMASGMCTHEGFVVTDSSGLLDLDVPLRLVVLSEGEMAPTHDIGIEIYAEDPMPQTISLSGQDYATCEYCVLGFRDCGESDCEQTFLAVEGELELTEIGSEPGSSLVGILRGVKFAEVSIADDATTTFVESGDTWCVDELSIDAQMGFETPTTMCDPLQAELTLSSQSATLGADEVLGEVFRFEGRSSDVAPYDKVVVELLPEFGASTEPNPYPIEYESFSTCSTCIIVSTGCDEQGECEKEYLAVEGQLDITEFGGVGGAFGAELVGVELFEHELDYQAFESVPVEGGESFCISSLTLTTSIDAR